jgi:hypothetical protein
MEKEDKPLDNGRRLRAVEDLDAPLAAAFSRTSAIALAIFDNQQHFRFVNNALVAIHSGVPADAFIGRTMRDIIGEAAPEPERRLQRLLIAGETPAAEVALMLPTRTEPGYWVEKNFTIKDRGGRVTQIASLAVEVTDNRKLEQNFRNICGDLLRTHLSCQQLARELHDSINDYHLALGMNLDRLSRSAKSPEKIPQLLAEFMGVDERMQKLASVVARCFPMDRH